MARQPSLRGQKVRALPSHEYYAISALAALSASSLTAIFWWMVV